jgi:predicted amidohydrolase
MPGKTKKIPSVRVAMVKAESAWGDVEANGRLLEELVSPLVDRRIDVVVTPECFLDGYMVRDKKRCTAKKLRDCAVSGPDDGHVCRVGRLARLLQSWFVLGASEKDASGVIRNAAYLLDREGKHAGTYYKVHPCEFYEPGDALPVFETDFATVGIVICADRRWPENIRCLMLQGAKIILNPTWGFWGDLNTAIIRTRAYENGIPVCFTHPHQSLICNGKGEIAAVLESGEPDVLVHAIDLTPPPRRPKSKDRAWSHPTSFRRPELYGPLVDKERKR